MNNLQKYRLSKVKPAMVHFKPPTIPDDQFDRLLHEWLERPNLLVIDRHDEATVQFIPCGHPRLQYTSSL